MGREFIGECPGSGKDADAGSLETELKIKYIKENCGNPPRGTDVQVTWEDHELGSYPVISVVWDDYTTEYPDEYIGKCIEAVERFDLPEEIHKERKERAELFREMYSDMEKWFDPHRA